MSPTLTALQQQVLDLLAEGSTITAAAEAVGVHRNTILNWRRASTQFQDALNVAQFQQAVHWRDQLQALGEIALETLSRILNDENTPARARLSASLAVLDRIMKPMATFPALERIRNDAQFAQSDVGDNIEVAALSTPEIGVEEDVDSSTTQSDAPKPQTPRAAQPRTTRQSEPGRNAPCPCGSGLKHKRCCLSSRAFAAASTPISQPHPPPEPELHPNPPVR